MNKIISLIILPVMIFSFTGASLHVHICSKTGDVYSDIHLLNHKHEHHESTGCKTNNAGNTEGQSCCSEDDPDKKQCGNTDYYRNHKDSHLCYCIDIEKKIETDNNYKFSQHTYRLDPVEIRSLITGIPGNEILQPKEQLYASANSFVFPPKLHSSIVLLL